MNIAVVSAIVITAFLAAGVLLLISFSRQMRRVQNNPPPGTQLDGADRDAVPAGEGDDAPPLPAARDERPSEELGPPTIG